MNRFLSCTPGLRPGAAAILLAVLALPAGLGAVPGLAQSAEPVRQAAPASAPSPATAPLAPAGGTATTSPTAASPAGAPAAPTREPAPVAATAAGTAAAASSSPAAATLSVSRQQAIVEALRHNAGILAAAEQVEEARAQVVTAAAFVDPTLAYDTMGESHVLDWPSGNVSDLYLTFSVPFPGKRGLRRGVAAASLHAAEQTLVQTRQQVASQAAQDYDALQVALRHRVDLQESRKFSLDFLTKTQARFEAGTAPKVDVVKAKVDLAQADDDLIANERTIDSARATLNRVLGRNGGLPLAIAEELKVPPALPPVEQLETLALASRPELRSNDAQRKGARDATKLAKEFWLPDFNFTLERNAPSGPGAPPATYTTQLLVGFPIFFWQHTKGEVANAEHREAELAAGFSDLRVQVSLDVRSAYSTAATALRQVVFLRDELLPEAREVYRVAAASYSLGASSALDFLDAKRTLVDAERQFVDALGAANDAQAALELAMAAPVPDVPSAAGAPPAVPTPSGDHHR